MESYTFSYDSLNKNDSCKRKKDRHKIPMSQWFYPFVIWMQFISFSICDKDCRRAVKLAGDTASYSLRWKGGKSKENKCGKLWKAHLPCQSHVDYLQYLYISALYIGHDVTKWCLLSLPSEWPSVRRAPASRFVQRWNIPPFLLRNALHHALVVRLHVCLFAS